MVSVAQLGLRTWTFIWTLLAMSLVGNVIALTFSGHHKSAVNYGMFTAAFCMVVVLYGFVAAVVEAVAIPLVLIVVDALAAIFSIIAGIVLAAKLTAHSCTNFSYISTNDVISGGRHLTQRCRELQASTAFFWFMFAGFVGSMIVTALGARTTGMAGRGGGVRRGAPAMSQV